MDWNLLNSLNIKVITIIDLNFKAIIRQIRIHKIMVFSCIRILNFMDSNGGVGLE